MKVVSTAAFSKRNQRIEYASISNGGTVSIASQSGPWIKQVTRNGAGDVTITFADGMFSLAPTVTATVDADAAAHCRIYSRSKDSVSIYCKTDAGVASDRNFNLIAMGPA